MEKNINFDLSDYHRNVPDSELIEDLKYVANFIKKKTVTIDEYNEFGRFHATTLTRRFGSWFKCLELAGLAPSRSKIGISDEELFEEIEKIWVKLGKQPSYTQMRDSSQYSIGTYEKRFGGWRRALTLFINYVDEDSIEQQDDKEQAQKDQKEYKHRTPRAINLRMRFIVFQRDNFKCCACGASPAKDPSVELHIDHVIPWSKGGETKIDNLQTLCSKCNLGKSDLI